MKELDCVIGPCLDAFLKNPTGTTAIVVFGSIAFFSIVLIIKKDNIRSRIRWSYPLVFSLLFLLTYFTFSMVCHENLKFCTERALMYSIPLAVIGSIFFGYLLFPNLYLALNKTTPSRELSEVLPTYVPVHIANNGKPFAFSYGGLRKWIVVSQGMIDILTRKELNAVLLHEYGHLTNDSSFYKSSNWIYSKIPLLSGFLDGLSLEDEDENAADEFAIKAQRTPVHLKSAKKKLEEYFR